MSLADARGPAGPFVLAVAGATLAAAVLLIAVSLAEQGMGGLTRESPILLLLLVPAAILVIAAAALLIGLPLTVLLDRSRAERAWIYPAAGLVAGGAIPVALHRALLPMAGYSIPELLVDVAPFGALPGGVCGALWWWLYRRHVQEER